MKMNTAKSRLTKIGMLLFCSYCFSVANATTIVLRKTEIKMPKNEPAPAQKVITQFLQWYKINLNKANSFRILIKDNNDNYIINQQAVTGYLNFLKSSKCLSPKYIAYWQTFFDDKANQLEKEKIKSDIPEGFDFDFVLITQEPDLVLNRIKQIKFKTVSMNNTVALIGLKWPVKNTMQYQFEMYKTNVGWQIGYISTPNFD